MPVGVALPLQRHRPGLVLGACLAELAALASVILTAEPAAFAILALSAGVLVALATTNQRRVLAFTSTGVLVVVASAKGRPVAVAGSAPSPLDLPRPAGLGGAVELEGRTWWIDRSAFPRLRRARDLLDVATR